ncbi:MAG: hypothetical protein CMM25_04810, partial [Rhodospirillaceae bacterium]|nr:hypothetical protein [Rhodospirillaceae bacterium]
DIPGFVTQHTTIKGERAIKISLDCFNCCESNFSNFISNFHKIFDNKFILVVDFRGCPMYPLSYIHRIISLLKSHEDNIRDNVEYTIIIVESTLARIFVNTFLSLYTPIKPILIQRE